MNGKTLFFSLILIAAVMTTAAATEIALDLKVSSDPNSVNLRGGGVVPFTLFGTDRTGFSRDDVNHGQVNWQNVPMQSHRVTIEDKNADGIADLNVFIQKGWLRAILTGSETTIKPTVCTSTGVFHGTDSIRIVSM